MDQRRTAIYYLDRRAYGRAEHCMCEWVLSQPDDIYAHMELIWCFHKSQSKFELYRWRECDTFYDDVYDGSNHKLVRSFVDSEQMFYDGRLEGSIQEYRATIAAGLDVPTVHHSLGIALKDAGRYGEAQEEFETVLSLDPFFLPALYTYGELLFSEGRFDRLEDLVGQLTNHEDDAFHLVFKDAREDIARLRSLKKAAEELRNAVYLLNEDKVHEALLTFWPVFRDHKCNCSFIETVVSLFYQNNWLELGERRLRDELANEGKYARYAEGLILLYQGKHEEALEAFNEAIEKGLDHPLVYCSRAIAFEALDQKAEEQADLLHAHTRQPWLAYARAELAENASEESEFARIIQLADLNTAEREHTLACDVSGRGYLARLEQLALRALMQQDTLSIALSRVESDSSPINDARPMFERAMVYAANDNLVKAAEELTKAVEIEEKIVAYVGEEDIVRIKEIADQMPQSFGAAFSYAFCPVYEENYQEALSRLKSLTERFPENMLLQYHIARISYTAGDLEQSKEVCRQAISDGLASDDTIELLCFVLKEEENVKGLIELSDELCHDVLPLKYALDLAESQGQSDLARNIAYTMLDRKPGEPRAVQYIAQTIDNESLEYARMLEDMVKRIPLEFELRLIIAWIYQDNDLPAESLKHFKAMISNGINAHKYGIPAVLSHGLLCMAQDTQVS